jgi:hypothetical protein
MKEGFSIEWMGTVYLLAIVVGVEFDVPRELLTMRGWRLTVEQALLYGVSNRTLLWLFRSRNRVRK